MSTLTAIAGIAGGISSVTAVAGFVVPDHAAGRRRAAPRGRLGRQRGRWPGCRERAHHLRRARPDRSGAPRIGLGAWSRRQPLRLVVRCHPRSFRVDLVVLACHFDPWTRDRRGTARRPAVVTAATVRPPASSASARSELVGCAVSLRRRAAIEVRAIRSTGAPGAVRTRGYNGYVLRREGRALLFGGDTARAAVHGASPARSVHAAIMPIGAFIRGSTTTATPSRRSRWPMRRAPSVRAGASPDISVEPRRSMNRLTVEAALAAERDRLACEGGQTVRVAEGGRLVVC